MGGATGRQRRRRTQGVGRRSERGTQKPGLPVPALGARAGGERAAGSDRAEDGPDASGPPAPARGASGLGAGAGRRGVGPPPPPPPLSSDVRPRDPALLRAAPPPASRAEGAAPPRSAVLRAFLDLLSVTRSWFRSPKAHPNFYLPKPADPPSLPHALSATDPISNLVSTGTPVSGTPPFTWADRSRRVFGATPTPAFPVTLSFPTPLPAFA